MYEKPALRLLIDSFKKHSRLVQQPHVICIDGPAGSGKTTLAAQLAHELNAQTIHMDDLYDGWEGIHNGVENLVSLILEPLAQGKAGAYRRFDWLANAYAETHAVPLNSCLVVEGCASATRWVDQFNPFIVWVETDAHTRLKRGLARDGHELKEQWLRFMEQEMTIYEEERTRQRAHVLLDGFGNIVESRV
ncbi:uridine kinase family protein [Timonella sp. A28]|uniref:uridine kinase family protein n=1 Tax=Timonella sp. A28 TaxID=3442640 RepID=UPI003EB8132C